MFDGVYDLYNDSVAMKGSEDFSGWTKMAEPRFKGPKVICPVNMD